MNGFDIAAILIAIAAGAGYVNHRDGQLARDRRR
jgi:hypothetical protein